MMLLEFLHHPGLVGVDDPAAVMRANVMCGRSDLCLVPGAVAVTGIGRPDHGSIFFRLRLFRRRLELARRRDLISGPALKFKREILSAVRTRHIEMGERPRGHILPEDVFRSIRRRAFPDKFLPNEIRGPVLRQPDRVRLRCVFGIFVLNLRGLVDHHDSHRRTGQVRVRPRSGHKHRAVGHHHFQLLKLVLVPGFQDSQLLIRRDQRMETLFRNLPLRKIRRHAPHDHDRDGRILHPVARDHRHHRRLPHLHRDGKIAFPHARIRVRTIHDRASPRPRPPRQRPRRSRRHFLRQDQPALRPRRNQRIFLKPEMRLDQLRQPIHASTNSAAPSSRRRIEGPSRSASYSTIFCRAYSGFSGLRCTGSSDFRFRSTSAKGTR